MPEGEEEGKQIMQAWTDWFGSLGDALVDGGNPASATKTISPDGSVRDDPSGPSGYSIIKADSMDAAVALAKGCPVLRGGASLQVVETFRPILDGRGTRWSHPSIRSSGGAEPRTGRRIRRSEALPVVYDRAGPAPPDA